MTSEDDFAPIWEESILLEEHEAVQASVDVGGWLSAALDDPNVCDQMKADINRWFSAGFLYLDSVRQLMQADREAVRAEQAAEIERLRLDVEAQEALQVSAYHAGLRAGWNFGVSDDNAGMQAAMANTDHIKELRRIREARAALGESHD